MENVVHQLTYNVHTNMGSSVTMCKMHTHTQPLQVIRAADRLESNTLQCKQSCSVLSGKEDRSLVRPDCNHNYLSAHSPVRSLLKPDCSHNYLSAHSPVLVLTETRLQPQLSIHSPVLVLTETRLQPQISAHSPVLTDACPRFCLRSLRCL